MLNATMLSLARAIALRAPLTALRSTAPRLSLASEINSHRAFSNTPLIFALAATTKKKSAASKTTTGRAKSQSKATAKPKTRAKAKAKPSFGAKPKPKGRPRSKSVKPKVSTRVPQALRPPKRSPTPFVIFYRRAFSEIRETSGIIAASKAAGTAWANLTEAEKKPFVEEGKVLRDSYILSRDKWFKDPKNTEILKTLNKARVKKGKSRIRPHPSGTANRPVPAFIRFTQSLRNGSDPSVSLSDAPAGESALSPQQWFVREAGLRWRALPISEKDKFIKEYEADKAKWQKMKATASPNVRV